MNGFLNEESELFHISWWHQYNMTSCWLQECSIAVLKRYNQMVPNNSLLEQLCTINFISICEFHYQFRWILYAIVLTRRLFQKHFPITNFLLLFMEAIIASYCSILIKFVTKNTNFFSNNPKKIFSETFIHAIIGDRISTWQT